MMNINNRFLENLNKGKKMVGGWLMSGNATIAELMSCVGYDYLVVDLEHGSDNQSVTTLLRSIEQYETLAVIRMPSQDYVEAKKTLDAGAQTFLFPFVQNKQQSQQVISNCYYPPIGKRGFAKMHRASRYGTAENYMTAASEQLAVVVQIETLSAIENIQTIGTVDHVTALFLGPGDLSVDMGLNDARHPKVKEQMVLVAEKCKEIQKPVGTVMPTVEDAKWAFSVGYQFVSIASDLALLKNSIQAQLAEIKI